jgi:hypothetical protein
MPKLGPRMPRKSTKIPTSSEKTPLPISSQEEPPIVKSSTSSRRKVPLVKKAASSSSSQVLPPLPRVIPGPPVLPSTTPAQLQVLEQFRMGQHLSSLPAELSSLLSLEWVLSLWLDASQPLQDIPYKNTWVRGMSCANDNVIV